MNNSLILQKFFKLFHRRRQAAFLFLRVHLQRHLRRATAANPVNLITEQPPGSLQTAAFLLKIASPMVSPISTAFREEPHFCFLALPAARVASDSFP